MPALLALLVLVACLVTAWRPQAAAAASWGSIVLDCHAEGVALAGDAYGIVRVADVTYDAESGTISSYETLEPFADFGYDWSDMKASEVDEAAKALAAHAGENGLYELTSVTNASGAAGFWGLESGLYLVARIDVAPANEGYACDPLLLSVPMANGGQLLWAVTSQPKFESPSEPGEPVEPPAPEEPEEPAEPEKPAGPEGPIARTGDVALAGMGALLTLGGAGVILSGVFRRRSAEPEE